MSQLLPAGGIDLHLHTLYSDGTDTPAALVERAGLKGLAAIAVTDHDTVDGVEEAVAAGRERGVEVIPGIELTAEHEGVEIHVLGYLVDHRNEPFCRQLALLKQYRISRVHKITEKLNTLGVPLKAESVFALSGHGTVGRLHIALALVKEGLVQNIYEAFQKYIGDRSPGYVGGFRLTPEDAFALIRKAGGVPVLAHPYTMRKDELIPVFIQQGLMGLEVHYPEHSQSMVNFYLALAREHGVAVTGGSDYHGKAKPDVDMGAVKVPYELLVRLKEAAARTQ